ncbi:hypothetical protein, partial [Kingella kingae]|uniref:hypothetical protein n=1 Tax=Kingella kingae TaxID=504 RepID=UPI0037C019A8
MVANKITTTIFAKIFLFTIARVGAIDNSKKRGKGYKILFPHNHPKPLPCPETRLQMKHGQ